MSEVYLVKGFYIKNAFQVSFQSKSKSFYLFLGVLVYSGRRGVIYDSQATNRSETGGGGSHRQFSLLLTFLEVAAELPGVHC